jgi:hypothetical protein
MTLDNFFRNTSAFSILFGFGNKIGGFIGCLVVMYEIFKKKKCDLIKTIVKIKNISWGTSFSIKISEMPSVNKFITLV